MRFVKITLFIVAAFAAIGMASWANADTLDSSAFTYRYEMNVMPSTQDLDNNGKPTSMSRAQAPPSTLSLGCLRRHQAS